MKLGTNEREPFLQPVALQGAGGGRQPAGRLLIGQVLHDGRALGKNTAVIKAQRRHVAFRIDCHVILASFGFVVGEVNLLKLNRDPRFSRDDMRGKGTGAGGIIEFHSFLLVVQAAQGCLDG